MLLHILLHFRVGVRDCMREPNCIFAVLESVVERKRVVVFSTLPTTVVVLQEAVVVHISRKLGVFNLRSHYLVLEVFDVLAAPLPPILELQGVLTVLDLVGMLLLVLF
jgi:hypothetical protein